MGALLGGNADRQWGYKIGDKIVPPSIDRIDGGGPGRSGSTFEGGGLLSDIGNALMRPYGYRDRMQAVRPQVRPTGLLSTPPVTPPAPAPQSVPQAGNIEDISSLPARLMPKDYFIHLNAEGRPYEDITPIGQPMTGQELLEMPRYMEQARQRRDMLSIARGYESPAVPLTTAVPATTTTTPPIMSPELEAELRKRGMTDAELRGYGEEPLLLQMMEMALREGRLEDYLR